MKKFLIRVEKRNEAGREQRERDALELKGEKQREGAASRTPMGNSYAGQLRTTRFEEVLHNSIEASLRSNTIIPRPVFSQLYLETEQPLARDDEDDEDGSESNSPPIPYQMKPPPEGCCTTDGFCQAGRDLRLSSLASDPLDVPPGFMLVGVKSPSLPENLLVCAVDRRFLPDERGRYALLGFSGNCMGCGEKGFRYFTEFSNHINLKLNTQPKKQKHLKYYLYRNSQGLLVKGAPICWRGNGKRIHIKKNIKHRVEPTSALKYSLPFSSNGRMRQLGPTLSEGQSTPDEQPPNLALSQPSHTPGSHSGVHVNTGPPKKRHKGWSPESSTSNLPESTAKTPPSSLASSTLSVSSTTAQQGSSQWISTPLSPPEVPVIVPDQLLQTCRLQPVIFKGHGPLPQLTGNVSDVLVSSLLQSCYLSSQTLPRVYQHYGPSPIQPLSTEMQILLTVYYLVQLGNALLCLQIPPVLPGLPQYLSLPSQSPQPLTPSQLPWLAQLAASSYGEGVVVLGKDVGSLAQGLQLTFSRLMEGRLENTNYVVIIVTAPGQETQSCVVVTGKHQCRALAESMFSPSQGLKEIAHQLSTGVAQELIHYCNSLGQDGDIDSLLDNAILDSNEPSPLSSSQESAEERSNKSPRVTHSPKDSHTHLSKDSPKDTASSPKDTCSEYSVDWREVRPIQLAVARKLLSHVCAIADSSTQNLDLGSFDRVSFLILVPPSEVTFQQTILHLWSSGVLQELGSLDQACVSHREAERYVVKMDHSAQARIDSLIREAYSNSYTLYILVHDHAHWDISSATYSSSDSGLGLVDQLLNSRQVRDATNILILHVTSFPFALQTQCTRISPYNEIHWPSAFSNDVDLYHERTRYFGVSELLESTHSGSSLPLMRYDSSFESMAATLEERFPKLHSAVIRTTVLIQHYCVALMAVSGRFNRSHNLQKHTSVETMEIVQSLVNAAQQCRAHHGHMVLVRIPSLALAAWAHQRLSGVRKQLGLEENFEIILGNPKQALNIGQSFTDQIKKWLKIQDADWVPRTYLELEALPCILILSGAEPLGESLPRSLKYCDLRVISCSYLQRTTLEQELGLAAYLVKKESRPPQNLGSGSDLLESDAEKLSSTDNEEEEGQDNSKISQNLYFISKETDKLILPLLSKMMTCTEQSLYYRQWTVPRSYHMDSSNRTEGRSDNFHPRRLLLSGPPQVGKTGAYLHFLGILSRMLIRLMEVDIYDEEDINCNSQTEGVQYHPASAPWPNPEIVRTIPFDYTIHDSKYDDISTIYCPGYKPNSEGNPVRQEDVYLRRRTARIKLSKYAAYNTYHHCEQCHQYLGFNSRYQMCESTLHAFTFTHLLLGEEIQLYFIIPKSKEHYFSFSQPGGQLESMRLPLTSDWSPDCIKSPIFTPTTGRHEHGLFNLYHAMDGASHLHILVVKEYEMAVYKKYWPNHIMLVLPTVFNGAGIGAAHFLIKELSYHNLELERSRRLEGGGPAGDVWPFIILADDSCVMWNTVDLEARNGPVEHAVSLKQVLQHMEACPDLSHYGLCGIRKWSSRGLTGNVLWEPFSRGHLHDFFLLNVDRSQNVQLHSAGLLVCRFNNFSVMKKQIAIGGYRTFIIKTKMTDVPTSVSPSQYICAPDSKHLFLATPAQLLLEKYLQHNSHKLFPLSTKNYTHPVLSVDCYLNLGPEVTVCFVSSRPHSVNISTAGLLFSGLILCFADSFVTPGFLKKFTFLKGATLCVISADRSSLRETVGRLELEEEWRFRLSDEFQTANAKEDRPLFFLTGKHI
ncbi:general transcription factor 3C polypeptide 1 [Sarotherodon galilaeus]